MVLTVHVNGDCVTQVIGAGNYLLSIHHDGGIDDSLPIFLIPNPQDSEQTRETEGIFDRLKLVASNILKQIERTVTKDAQAQTLFENTETLLSANSCVECNLELVRLGDVDLFDANFCDATWRIYVHMKWISHHKTDILNS